MYLISLSSMNTCDTGEGERADVVITASFVVPDLAKFSSDDLQRMGIGLEQTLRTAPIEDIKPMTTEEVATWRDEKRQEDAMIEKLKGNIASAQLYGAPDDDEDDQ